MPPMDMIESTCEDFEPRNTYSTEDFDMKLENPLFRGVYSKNILEFDPRKGALRDNVYVRNILAVFSYINQHPGEYEMKRMHLFLFVNSTKKTRELANRVLETFSDGTRKEKEAICTGDELKELDMPSWIDDKYLDAWDLEMRFDVDQSINMASVYQFDELPIFKKQDFKDKDEIKQKLRFILYIALAQKTLEKETKEREEDIETLRMRQTQQPGQAGLFTQPPVWCDDDTNESAWNNTPVCCRCGMCSAQPGVVQSTQSNKYIAYSTAPRTHLRLNTFFTQAADPTRNGLPVFAVAPMRQMQYVVPDTQRRQIYIWQP